MFAGVAMVVVGLFVLHATLVGWAVAAAGVVAAMTGLVGFCPMCAAVGRCPVAPAE